MTPAVELVDVHVRLGGIEVLRGVSLAVAPGEVVAFVGPSGSGKSTALRTMTGLAPICSGEVRIAGSTLPTDPRSLADVRATVGVVFQSYHLFSTLTALENVTFGPSRVLGRDPMAAMEQARHLLASVGMADYADARATELSGGQQQRVAIARALAMEPDILLCDEPTSALDPALVTGVLDLLTNLARQGRTMVVVTHEMSFARRAADRVVLFDAGRVAEVATPAEFFTAPQTEAGRRFRDAVQG